MKHTTSNDIIAALPPDAMERLGFADRNLRLIKQKGLFPGAWYGPVADECERAGIPCPRDAFKWKGRG